MAKRRMLSIGVLTSDAYLDLSHGAQALYVQLAVAADDDGMLGNIRGTARMLGCDMACAQELEEAGFLISFASGVYAILHWNMHNHIRRDRHQPTVYQQEFGELYLTPEGCYTRDENAGEAANACKSAATGKDRSGEDRQEEVSPAQESVVLDEEEDARGQGADALWRQHYGQAPTPAQHRFVEGLLWKWKDWRLVGQAIHQAAMTGARNPPAYIQSTLGAWRAEGLNDYEAWVRHEAACRGGIPMGGEHERFSARASP